MKYTLSLLFSLSSLFCSAQVIPLTEIEGRLSVYLPDDTTSIHIGKNAGINQESSQKNNTFLGTNSGFSNTSGNLNSFFGNDGGFKNTIGTWNSFFGYRAGYENTIGNKNSFFGFEAGLKNSSSWNSFFGYRAGGYHVTGIWNSFFGFQAGINHKTGQSNSFLGANAGYNIKEGSFNICIGSDSGPTTDDSTAISRLFIDVEPSANPLIYGEFDSDLVQINGIHRIQRDDVQQLEIINNGDGGLRWRISSSNNNWQAGGGKFLIGNNNNTINAKLTIQDDGNVGINTTTPTQKLDVLGNIRIRSVGAGTFANDIGITSNGTLTTTSSDIRLKKNIEDYKNALDKLLSIRGVSFEWKESKDNKPRLGVIAQEVQGAIPEVVFENDGYLGVNYSQLSAVFIEAIKEQQSIIEDLKSQLESRDQKFTSLLSRIEQLENGI